MNYISMEEDLVTSAANGNLTEVKRLVALGANINHGPVAYDKEHRAVTGTSRRALPSACQNGHFDVAVFLSNNPKIDLNARHGCPKRGYQTALALAAIGNHGLVVKHLLSKSTIDVNAQRGEDHGNTALHHCCIFGRSEMVELLLGHPKIDVLIKNNAGKTALDLAKQKHRTEIQTLISDHMDDFPDVPNLTQDEVALLRASKNGHMKHVETLFRTNNDKHNILQWNINAQDAMGRTALHLASMYGHHHVVEFLCNDPRILWNARDTSGRTPLHLACAKEHHSVVEILLDHRDSNCQVIMWNKKTPLDLCRRDSIIRWYFEKACPQKEIDPETQQFLDAARAGRIAEISALGKKHDGLNLNRQVVNGMTALHLASRFGHVRLVQFLVQQPTVELGVRDFKGRTALHEACRWHDTAVPAVSILLSKMTSEEVNREDLEGRTALQIAWACQNMPAVTAFLDSKHVVTPHLVLEMIAHGNSNVQVLKKFIKNLMLGCHRKLSGDGKETHAKNNPQEEDVTVLDFAASVLLEDGNYMKECLRKSVDADSNNIDRDMAANTMEVTSFSTLRSMNSEHAG